MDNSNPERTQGNEQKDITDILIVGTTNGSEYQFLRIKQKAEGDIIIENRYKVERHLSYHSSGELHEIYVDKQGKRTSSILCYGLPIAEFRGSKSLGGWTIYAPDLPVWKKLAPNENQPPKSEPVIRFDMNNLSGTFAVNIWLIESSHEEYTEAVLQTATQNTQLLSKLLVTDTNPWILILAMAV
jgi:hypothetical protein